MSEEQIKEIIEQVGYQEFYRYFQEKTTLIEQQRKEIERLNNIINELEIVINKRISKNKKEPIKEKERNRILYDLTFILDKLQELKGSDKE